MNIPFILAIIVVSIIIDTLFIYTWFHLDVDVVKEDKLPSKNKMYMKIVSVFITIIWIAKNVSLGIYGSYILSILLISISLITCCIAIIFVKK